jgi:hypothetical protein
MPARTNDFQKLVKIINHSLAPVDAKVTESAMLYDSESDTDREVDILIESSVLNCNIKIGIECTEVKRPVDVKMIESFKEKHRKLNINQTVIVSKNGFTNPAKNYAKKNNIKLLSFNSANSENWSKNFERLKNLSMYARNYFVHKVIITASQNNADPQFIFDTTNLVKLSNDWIPLHEFVKQAFTSSNIGLIAAKELRENELSGSDPWVNVGFDLKKEFPFKDKNERIFSPEGMEVTMGYKSNYRELSPKQVKYDDNEFVVGGFFDKANNEFAHIAVKAVDNNLVASVEISTSLFPKQDQIVKKKS